MAGLEPAARIIAVSEETNCEVCCYELAHVVADRFGEPILISALPANFSVGDLTPGNPNAIGIMSTCGDHWLCTRCWSRLNLTNFVIGQLGPSIRCPAIDDCKALVPVSAVLPFSEDPEMRLQLHPLLVALTMPRVDHVSSVCSGRPALSHGTVQMRLPRFVPTGRPDHAVTERAAAAAARVADVRDRVNAIAPGYRVPDLQTIAVTQTQLIQRYTGHITDVCRACLQYVCVDCHRQLPSEHHTCDRCWESPTGAAHVNPPARIRKRFNRFLPHPGFAPFEHDLANVNEQTVNASAGQGEIGGASDTTSPLIRNGAITPQMALDRVLELIESKEVTDMCAVCRTMMHRSVDCNELHHCKTVVCSWCGYTAPIDNVIWDTHWNTQNEDGCPRYVVGAGIYSYMCEEGNCATEERPCTVPEHEPGRVAVEYARQKAHLSALLASVPWLVAGMTKLNRPAMDFANLVIRQPLRMWPKPWATTPWRELLDSYGAMPPPEPTRRPRFTILPRGAPLPGPLPWAVEQQADPTRIRARDRNTNWVSPSPTVVVSDDFGFVTSAEDDEIEDGEIV